MITAREVYGFGLICGLSLSEMRHTEPGFIMDMMYVRGEYLSSMFGGRKKKKKANDDFD